MTNLRGSSWRRPSSGLGPLAPSPVGPCPWAPAVYARAPGAPPPRPFGLAQPLARRPGPRVRGIGPYARLFVPQPAGTVRPGEKTTLASTRVSGVFCFPGFGLFGVPRGRNYLLALGNLISFRPVCFRAWGSVIGPISGGYLGFEHLAYSTSVFLARPSL